MGKEENGLDCVTSQVFEVSLQTPNLTCTWLLPLSPLSQRGGSPNHERRFQLQLYLWSLLITYRIYISYTYMLKHSC